MKYKKYIITPMVLALLSVATSCEQEELPPAMPDSDVVEVTASIGSEAETRVSQPQDNVYTFDADDKIHIVGWYGAWGDYNKPWETASDAWWNDAASTYDATSRKWKTEPYMRWHNGENLSHHFLAWWPEDFVKSTDNLTAVPVTLTGDYRKDDILVARWSGTRPEDNTIDLRFKHLLSRFDVHLHFRDEYPNHEDIAVQTNLNNQAVCDFLTGEATGQTGQGITLQDRPYPDANWDWSGTCITVPQVSYNPLLTLTFLVNGEKKEINYRHSNSLIFKPGERTTLILEVGKMKLELMEVTVTDWDNHNINAGEAEEDI